MDLNDPRRRLQVAKVSNPSLRMATVAKEQPKITGVATKPFNVKANFTPQAVPGVAQAQQFNIAKNATLQVARPATQPTLSEVVGGTRQTEAAPETPFSRLSRTFSPISQGGINPLADVGNFIKDTIVKPTVDNAINYYNQSKLVNEARKNGVDNVRLAYGDKTASFFDKNSKKKSDAAISDAEKSTGIELQDSTDRLASGVQLATDIAGATSLVKPVSKVLGGIGAKAKSLLTNDSKDFFANIVKENDPAVIKQALNVDDVTAQYLAQETNQEAVKQVIQEISVDKNINIPDSIRKRLQDEGITAIKKEDTPYGAEYNPTDRSISVKSQADATDANLYHELGHDIWKNRLTPEERKLFEDVNGPGFKEAASRAGYSKEDMVSEDFSNLLRSALTDGIESVPEKYRAVIAKYAGIAEKKLLPAVSDSTKNLPRNVGNGFVMAEQGARGIKVIQQRLDKINKTFRDIQLGKKTMSREEISSLAAEQEDLIKKANEPFADAYRALDGETLPPEHVAAIKEAGGEVPQTTKVAEQADAVAKAQSGTSETSMASTDGVKADTGFVKNADEFNPDAAPGDRQAIQKVLDELNGAEKAYVDKSAIVAKEKATRAAAGSNSYDAAGGGEAGFRAFASKLQGKYTKSAYEPISVDQATEKTLLDAIHNSKDLQDFEKFNTQNALRKVWGANPDSPTQSDVNYIRKFFNSHYGEGVGDDLAKSIEDAVAEGGSSYQDVVTNIAGLPRALMATGDLSGGFRQAAPLGTRFPKIWANANKESVKYAVNPKYYEAEMRKIADAPDYEVITDKLGVDLTGVGALQDEAFLGAGYAERIPVAGVAIKGADRAYTGVLTRMRYDVAHKIVEDAGGPQQYVKNMEELYGDSMVKKGLTHGSTNKADRAMRSYGEVINTLTGRGGMKGGALDSHMKTASTLLFAPRLWAANLQRLNPVWYVKLYRDNPEAAKLAASSAGTFYGMVGSVLGLAVVAGPAVGVSVGLDARSADFLKIKYGNTRYDILGGQQQIIVQIARQVTGEKVNSETGEVQKLGDGFGKKNRLDIFGDMLNNKANPLLAFALGLSKTKPSDSDNPLIREDEYGNEYNVADKVARLFIPLGIQGGFDTAADISGDNPTVGSVAKGLALNAPSVIGIGVQTYGNQKTGDFKTTGDKKEYAGNIKENMVLDSKGKPILDEKGKVVTVDFPKDATALEKKAMLDDKRESALSSQFKNSLSREDQALLKLSDEQISKYVKDGIIDQDRADHIERLKKGAETWGRDAEIPDGVKSEPAQTFYKKYNSMTKKDQDYWLKQKPDENSKTITTLLNKQRVKGLPEFRASNELAKLYADYEKKLNTSEEVTETDKQKASLAFQKEALKLNYSPKQRDIYGSSATTLRTLADAGKISKKDLDKAIEMDNYIVASGLSTKAKFSKKFRRDFGYGLVASRGGGGSKGGYSSGSGGSKTKRAYLAALLPSASAGSSSAAPKFSAKRRTKGVTFKNVNLPQKSNSKKVTINL